MFWWVWWAREIATDFDPEKNVLFIKTITHGVNIVRWNLGSPLYQKQEISNTASCLETDFYIFYVLLAVQLIFILVINQLDIQNFCFTISLFHVSTCFEHHVLIIRRSKLCYAASGIITPIGGRPVHRTATYRVWWYRMLYNTILTSWWWTHGARNM